MTAPSPLTAEEIEKAPCQHARIQFGSGDFYLLCGSCGARWGRLGQHAEYGTDYEGRPIGCAPENANQGFVAHGDEQDWRLSHSTIASLTLRNDELAAQLKLQRRFGYCDADMLTEEGEMPKCGWQRKAEHHVIAYDELARDLDKVTEQAQVLGQLLAHIHQHLMKGEALDVREFEIDLRALHAGQWIDTETLLAAERVENDRLRSLLARV